LSTPFGPTPALGRGQASGASTNGHGPWRRMRISSTAFEHAHGVDVDAVVRGHLDEPRLDGSASELLARLYRRGRLCQFRYGAVPVGSIDLTTDSHPIALDGRPQERLWAFGVLTEGIRHFTHYIPSPRSRIRAFEDIGSGVAQILGEVDTGTVDAAAAAGLLEEQVA
ncbi:MAG: hypothetical protein ACRDNS_33875, partial [Trebonia sp.]